MSHEPESPSNQEQTPPPEIPLETTTRHEARKLERPERPDPTRYGDWEKDGRCIDF